ncbi:hypothetical protein B0J11DRAFT_407015, partial [Dendryphion nanum]
MPPHLHPRSRMTTSLFTTTLMVSFLVVATPHLLPCPVDTRAHMDSADPEAIQRRRRRRLAREQTCNEVLSEERAKDLERDEMARRKRRECPLPKPGGLIGQVLGVRETKEG